MSNKAEKLTLFSAGENPDLDTLRGIGTYVVSAPCTNGPPELTGVRWGLLTVMSSGTNGYDQRLILAVSQGLHAESYRRMYTGAYWTNWTRDIAAIPPQEYNLPLAEGWEANMTCGYYRTQEHEVAVTVAAHWAGGGAATQDSLVAQLPAGYRPRSSVVVPCLLDAYGAVTGHIMVDTGGGVYVRSNGASVQYATAQVRFLAGS